LCEKRKIYSYVPLSEPPSLYGAYSQYLWLHPNSVVHKVSPDLPAAVAAMFNPLGAGFRWAVEIPELHTGESLVILGPGQRGLASVLAARAAGAGQIIVTGLSADARKLELARRFGATHTIDVGREDARRRIRELTNGRGADVVLDVSSYALEPVASALDYVATGGRVVLAGVKGFKPVPDFVSDKIVMKEIRISGAIGVTSSAYRNAIRLIESQATPIADMHTHDFALRDASEAIRALEANESIHSVLVPPI
jgi:threonine dehydrogenase-like Zn-dependent dehydrogenase